MPWLLMLLTMPAQATSIGVVGLFRDKAMISVDGSPPKLIAVGQTVQGVKLLAADSDSATFEIEGKKRTLAMGQSFASAAGGGKATVTLSADPSGHFIAAGSINGSSVRFLLDTGATSVVLPASEAKRMGIDYKAGKAVGAGTANGVVPAWRVMLDSVRVGSINLNQVEGLVVESSMPAVLLGMSFLNRTDMKREGQNMTLTQRY
ncbi:MAG: TIGR02281 family clan AA aspartic protease [Pseudomonadota bacterium]